MTSAPISTVQWRIEIRKRIILAPRPILSLPGPIHSTPTPKSVRLLNAAPRHRLLPVLTTCPAAVPAITGCFSDGALLILPFGERYAGKVDVTWVASADRSIFPQSLRLALPRGREPPPRNPKAVPMLALFGPCASILSILKGCFPFAVLHPCPRMFRFYSIFAVCTNKSNYSNIFRPCGAIAACLLESSYNYRIPARGLAFCETFVESIQYLSA